MKKKEPPNQPKKGAPRDEIEDFFADLSIHDLERWQTAAKIELEARETLAEIDTVVKLAGGNGISLENAKGTSLWDFLVTCARNKLDVVARPLEEGNLS